MKLTVIVSGLVIAALAILPMNIAADIDQGGAGFAIPDNSPAGASSSILIAANERITDVTVTLEGASHSWVGDLNATLIGPSGSVDLFIRTGRVGGIGSGDSSDLGGNYSFNDAGGDWWAEAADQGSGGSLTPGIYFPTTTDGVATSLNSIFGGMNTAGTWTLLISDNVSGDTGSIASWRISFLSTAIPEPGTCGLLVCGLACLAIRRKRIR